MKAERRNTTGRWLILLLGTFFVISPNLFSQIRWERTNGPYGGTVRALAVDTMSGIVYASTFGNGVFRSYDQGTNWQGVNDGLDGVFVRALTVDQLTGTLYAGTDRWGILRSYNQGTNWYQIASADFASLSVQSILVIPGGVLFAGTSNGIYRSLDDGLSWLPMSTGLWDPTVYSLAYTQGGTLFAATGGGVLRSTNYGENWFLSGNTLTGKICYSVVVHPILGIAYLAADDGVYLSTDDGLTWITSGLVGSGLAVVTLAINPSDGAIYAGSDIDGILKSTDGGIIWNSVNTNLPSTITRSMAVDHHAGAIYAGLLGCGVYRSLDNGGSWMEQNAGLTGTAIYSLHYQSIGGLFAATPFNGLYHTTDNGNNWLHIGNDIRTLTVNTIFVHPSRSMFAGTNNGVYRSNDNGDTWTSSSDGILSYANSIYTIVMNATGDMFASSYSSFYFGAIYRSIDTGRTWSQISYSLPAGNIYSLCVTPDGTLFTIIDTLGVYRSTDNGTSWLNVGVGLTTKNLWTVSSVPLSVDPAYILLVGTDIGVFRSSDHGASWEQVMSGQDVNVFEVGPRRFLFCGTSTDGVYFSDDDGYSWYRTNDGLTHPNILSFGFTSRGMIFAGANGGGVWRGIPTFAMISVPSQIQFQDVAVGQSRTINATIQNVGGEFLQIDSIRIAGTNRNDFSISNVAANILLQPDETVIPAIQFAPSAGGVREANLLIFSDDPTLEIAAIPLRGVGTIGPHITVVDTISFGSVGVGSSADQEFAIQNTGSGNLRIDSMRVQMADGLASEFQFVNIVYPLTIAGGISQRVILRWSPESTGPRNGGVILYSNDLTTPSAQVILNGVALSAPVIVVPDTIGFGNVLTGTSADQNIVIKNTGSGDLRIDSIRVQAITGIASEYKVVNVVYPIFIGGGLNHQVTIRWSPTSDGYRSAQLTIFSNDPSGSGKQVFVQGTGVTDNVPPVFSNVSVPILKSPGNAVVIVADVTDASGIKDFYINYRTGNGPWQKADFNIASEPHAALIPASAVTTDGIDYRIVAVDSLGNITVWNGTAADQFTPIVITATADIFSFMTHGGTQQSDYRLFSVPLILNDQQVSQFFSGKNSPGANGTEWRLFRYVSPSGYEEWSTTNDFNIQAGRAYMLITSKNSTMWNTGGGVPSFGYLRVPGAKLEAGWNFIGALFPYHVALSDLELVPPVTNMAQNAFYYSGTGTQSGWDFAASGGITPWEGLAIRVDDTCRLKLKNPAATTPKVDIPDNPFTDSVNPSYFTFTDAPHGRTQDENEWVGQIIASDEFSIDRITYFGINSKITADHNPFVMFEPPAMPNTVSLFFADPENMGISDRHAADIRQSIGNGTVWDLELRAAPRTMVRLGMQNLNAIPSRLGVFLFDPVRNGLYDMRQRSYQDIYSSDGARSLQLIVGEQSYVEEAAGGVGIIPTEYALEQNYPNPFNPVTLIRYQIPEAGHVNLTLYSITGQEVLRPVDSEQSAGYYDVLINASDMASGVYFYRLTINGVQRTKKLAVVR